MMPTATSILKTFLAALMLLGAPSVALLHAQSSDPAVNPPGTEFYVAFMKNEDQRSAAEKFMGLVVTSEVTTTTTVTMPNGSSRDYQIPAGKATTIPVSREFEMHESPSMQALHITSRAPIAVYVLNSLYQSSGGYAAVPVDRWGSSYLPMSLPNADGERVSEFVVIASERTILNITPKAETNLHDKGVAFQQQLEKGEAYLVQARPGGIGTADLSSSEIYAQPPVPIGVISGHMRAPVMTDRTMPLDRWASHMATMLLPDDKWATEYYTVPSGAGADRYRMTAELDRTKITITHYRPGKTAEMVTVTLNRGDIFDSSTVNGTPITGPVHWSASQPILLMQFRTSGPYGNAENAPAMFAAPAVTQLTTMVPFVAPAALGSDAITAHTLTIIARGDGSRAAADASNPIHAITLDGRPLDEVSPGLAWTRIDGDFFTARLTIAAGAHVLASPDAAPFSASISGNSGTFGNFYSWQLPFWVPKTDADLKAPYVINTVETGPNELTAQISDRSATYYSGIADVSVVNSPNWKLAAPFVAPDADNDSYLTFQVTSDPSGPLYAALRDWNGNTDTVKLSNGFCAHTAYPDRGSVAIYAKQGTPAVDSVNVRANDCGDAASIIGLDVGTGNARKYMHINFGRALPIPLASHDVVPLYFTVDPATMPDTGIYITTVTVTLDVGTFELPVRLEVSKPAGVAGASNAGSLGMTMAPNPFHAGTVISFGRALGPNASVIMTDALGRTVRHLGADALAGRTSLHWDGTDDNGALLPAGLYILSAVDGTGRCVISARLVR